MDTYTHNSLIYFLRDKSPRVLLLSGTHGDEYESGKLLEQFLYRQHPNFPSFLYIPQISPSAVEAGTRKNKYNHDINRQFFSDTTDPEAQDVMTLLAPYRFTICIDIHEDPDRTLGFYLYDTGLMTEEQLSTYREVVHTTGARLYTGVDDVDDEDLNLHVEKGYVSLGFELANPSSGFSSRWLHDQGIAERTFTLEIPGKGSSELKEKLLHSVISFLLTTHGII